MWPFKKRIPTPPAIITVEIGPDERRALLKEITGSARAFCDLCGERVTQGNLATWDQDGHVYCDQHSHGVVNYRTGDVYHHGRTPPNPSP